MAIKIAGTTVIDDSRNADVVNLTLGGTALTATATELNYVDGVTSPIQTQLDSKKEPFEINLINTNTNADVGSHYYLASAGIELTFPPSPSIGDQVAVTELVGDTTSLILRNGSNIMGLAEDLTIDTAYFVGVFTYIDASTGWAFS